MKKHTEDNFIAHYKYTINKHAIQQTWEFGEVSAFNDLLDASVLLDQSNGARRPNAADSIAVITPKEYAQIDELGGLAWYGMVLNCIHIVLQLSLH